LKITILLAIYLITIPGLVIYLWFISLNKKVEFLNYDIKKLNFTDIMILIIFISISEVSLLVYFLLLLNLKYDKITIILLILQLIIAFPLIFYINKKSDYKKDLITKIKENISVYYTKQLMLNRKAIPLISLLIIELIYVIIKINSFSGFYYKYLIDLGPFNYLSWYYWIILFAQISVWIYFNLKNNLECIKYSVVLSCLIFFHVYIFPVIYYQNMRYLDVYFHTMISILELNTQKVHGFYFGSYDKKPLSYIFFSFMQYTLQVNWTLFSKIYFIFLMILVLKSLNIIVRIVYKRNKRKLLNDNNKLTYEKHYFRVLSYSTLIFSLTWIQEFHLSRQSFSFLFFLAFIIIIFTTRSVIKYFLVFIILIITCLSHFVTPIIICTIFIINEIVEQLKKYQNKAIIKNLLSKKKHLYFFTLIFILLIFSVSISFHLISLRNIYNSFLNAFIGTQPSTGHFMVISVRILVIIVQISIFLYSILNKEKSSDKIFIVKFVIISLISILGPLGYSLIFVGGYVISRFLLFMSVFVSSSIAYIRVSKKINVILLILLSISTIIAPIAKYGSDSTEMMSTKEEEIYALFINKYENVTIYCFTPSKIFISYLSALKNKSTYYQIYDIKLQNKENFNPKLLLNFSLFINDFICFSISDYHFIDIRYGWGQEYLNIWKIYNETNYYIMGNEYISFYFIDKI